MKKLLLTVYGGHLALCALSGGGSFLTAFLIQKGQYL